MRTKTQAKTEAKQLEDIQKIYAEIPKIDCKGLCHTSCGPVFMSRLEWDELKKAGCPEVNGNSDLTCPMLGLNNRCMAYEKRPGICRLWGVTELMPCIYGCVPERMLTEPESRDILRRLGVAGK